MPQEHLPLELRKRPLPKRAAIFLVLAVVLALAAALLLDRFAPHLVENHPMFSGVLAGTLTVPISLLIAVQLIDNARSRQAATAWKTFWGPVQKERLDLSAAPLAAADQIIAKCVDALGTTDPDKGRLAVLDANH